MRAREFIVEGISSGPVLSNLLSVLDNLRNRYEVPPPVRVDSLVNMVRKLPGSEMFNIDTLLSAYETNSALKNLIKDVKDDSNGVKVIHLKPALDVIDPESEVVAEPEKPTKISSPEKTVDQMSQRALKRRS